MEKNFMWIALALAGVWFFFLRNKTRVTGGANLSVATGNNATPYSGYPPGYVPPGTPVGGIAYNGSSPSPPSPIIVQQAAQGDSTGGILAGVGSLLGGLGQAAGSVLGGLGNSGLLGNSGGYSSGDDGGGGYVDDDMGGW